MNALLILGGELGDKRDFQIEGSNFRPFFAKFPQWKSPLGDLQVALLSQKNSAGAHRRFHERR